MKFSNKKMVEEALARIELIQKHIESLNAALSYAQRKNVYTASEITSGNLRDTLYQTELTEWRNMFLWAITLSDDERDRIKAAAYERFLSDKMGVAQWMFDGDNPGRWYTADEDEFREMAKEAFKPKELPS